MKERIKHLILFIVLVAIDQVSKFWVKTQLEGNEPVVIIKDILSLQSHRNPGAIWGILDGKVAFLIVFTFIVLALILYLYFKIPDGRKYNVLKTITVFIMAGAIGNLIDRIYLGYVVDFIYFEIIDFPLFNFADSCLTVASILLLILALFYYKEEDFAFLDQIFRKKKAASISNSDTNISTNDNKENKEIIDMSDLDGDDDMDQDEKAKGKDLDEDNHEDD